MFDLETSLFILLIFCLVAACGFEFVNGFHDTANAVATVIYTNTLTPWKAVIWSGICNFLGVFAGGISVAMSIVNLLPVEILIDQNIWHSLAMVLSLLFSAIVWNLGTWYFGLPASSSHTLIGAILGVGIMYSTLPGSTSAAVNWHKAGEVGLSLLVSPLFGFTMTILLMFVLRRIIKDRSIFRSPDLSKSPPNWIRSVLILTCTGVSFFHGSNDGQKGVGLMMLILIGILPTYYAIDITQKAALYHPDIQGIHTLLNRTDPTLLSANERNARSSVLEICAHLGVVFQQYNTLENFPKEKRFDLRKDILLVSKQVTMLIEGKNLNLNLKQIDELKSHIKKIRLITDYSPTWVIFLISLSLGLGTMIGWKRIVVTIGEKIGKQHLTYAQGATAEIIASSTIGFSTFLGLPVSTTHVLSSGIAGSMVAKRGIKNLQPATIRNIALAWLLTMPVSMTLSGAMFYFLRMVL